TLLKEAGLADGFAFDIYAYREREFTEAVIGDLVKVGCKPRLNYVQYTAFTENVHTHRARHLGLELGAGRFGHHGAFLLAGARRPHQGPGSGAADWRGRFAHRSRQTQGGLSGRTMARCGLRMMPPFPSSPLSVGSETGAPV